MVATGTLRRVVGTERKVRWIVDVTRLTEPDSRQAPRDIAKMTIRGTLRAALSQTGNTPDVSIATDRPCWIADSFEQALERAEELAAANELLLVTGSFYTVGAALVILAAPGQENG